MVMSAVISLYALSAQRSLTIGNESVVLEKTGLFGSKVKSWPRSQLRSFGGAHSGPGSQTLRLSFDNGDSESFGDGYKLSQSDVREIEKAYESMGTKLGF